LFPPAFPFLQAKPIPRPSENACKPLYPEYAADLQDSALIAANATDKLNIGNVTFTKASNGCTVNGETFSYPSPNPIPVPVGLVTEWNFGALFNHPVHTHTQPFQIVQLPPEVKDRPYTSWFKVRIGQLWYCFENEN
jgi:FtsP/CotA-like multicopper oxidase with cupredoxin domain